MAIADQPLAGEHRKNDHSSARVIIAKTALDGHWRGVELVARALRDGGFEVIMLGMATPESIVASAAARRCRPRWLERRGACRGCRARALPLRESGVDVPVMAGGTIAPWARKRLEAKGVAVFPPGSSMKDIVATARALTK